MHKNCGKGNIIMVQLLYYQRKETTTLEKMMRCLVPENKTYSQLQTFQEADKQKLRDLEKIPQMLLFPFPSLPAPLHTNTFIPIINAYNYPRIFSKLSKESTVERDNICMNHHLSTQINLQYLVRRTLE